MKIYVTHSAGFDYLNELYYPLRKSHINAQHHITLPYENSKEPFNSKEYMKECDLILAEVSYPSTGLGMELGWANLYNIPIVCIYKKETKLSKSLNTVSHTFIEYETSEDMLRKLEHMLNTLKVPNINN